MRDREVLQALINQSDFVTTCRELLETRDDELSAIESDLKKRLERKKHESDRDLRRAFLVAVLEMMVPKPHFAQIVSVDISGDVFRTLIGPGVYVFWDDDGKAQYVGSGKRVINRATEDSHESANLAALTCKHVEVCPAGSEAIARNMEATLIALHQPVLNKVMHRNYFKGDDLAS